MLWRGLAPVLALLVAIKKIIIILSLSDSEDNNDSCRKFKTGYIELAHFSMLKIYLLSDLYGGDIPAGQRVICECRLRGVDDGDGRLGGFCYKGEGKATMACIMATSNMQRSGSNSRA